MGTDPRVSVVMPIYNSASYLDAAVRSILKQTYTNFELFLLDDGSTDESPAILRKWAAQDPRCKLNLLPHRGIGATRNVGVDAASGEFIACMDADDLSKPERFATQIEYLDAHPECVAVGTTAIFIDPDGHPLCSFFGPASHEEIDASHMSGRGRICNPSVMMRTVAVRRVGGYRMGYGLADDLDLFLRLAELGKLAILPNILLEYRQHFASLSYRKRKGQWEAAIAAVAAAAARRGKTISGELSERDPSVSLAVVYRTWGWWALAGGNKATARKYAFKALILSPLDSSTLRLVACAIRGY